MEIGLQKTYAQRKKIANTRLRKQILDVSIHIFCFISVLLIGADLWSIDVGVNFRLDQLFLVIFAFLLVLKGEYRFFHNAWIELFAIFSLVSSLFAFNFMRGMIFWTSIAYNIIFVFYLFCSYVKLYGLNMFVTILRYTCYIQFAILLFQYILKIAFLYELPFLPTYGSYQGVLRFRIWFYEPSYLAIYISFWFALSCFMYAFGKDKSYLLDIIFALITFLLSTSTTGFVGMAIVIVPIFLVWFFRGNITSYKIKILCVVILLFLIVRFAFSSVFEVFVLRLFNSSLDSASGGRITRWKETFDVFKNNMLFGVGPGNYGQYLGMGDDHVPSNVSLELLATLGIFGFIFFYGLTIYLIVKSIQKYKANRDKKSLLLIGCAYALIIFTLLLQANQGYLRLYHWMFFGVIFGAIKRMDTKGAKCK